MVQLLQTKHVDVYLISGGFKCIIEPIASQLNIPKENIFANRLKFNFNGKYTLFFTVLCFPHMYISSESLSSGSYAGFDENEPTSRSGGKAIVVGSLKQNKGYQNLVLIGDGATDLEACPPADGFIGKHLKCLSISYFKFFLILNMKLEI